ncbi:MAG TPA: ABC transporter permease [Acetobacteraceae bacterium]|nr:ABC transporter permease [Acetobacteraceae bacterium]
MSAEPGAAAMLPRAESARGGRGDPEAPTRWDILRRSGTFWAGSGIVGFWALAAIFGPRLVPWDPYATDLLHELAPPSAAHWFGTDQLGRDIFSRVIAGSRDILTIAPLATLLGALAGVTLGLAGGYLGGLIDIVLGRIIEVLVSLPLIIVALLVIVALGPSAVTVVIVIGLVFAPLVARTVRAAVLGERALDYVAVAELRGESAFTIMFVEILPNIMGPVLVEATVRLGYAIFTVASLSFLGFGIQPPSPDWGLAIAENYGVIAGGYWWTVAFDAAATASLVVGVNLLADGLHGALTA